MVQGLGLTSPLSGPVSTASDSVFSVDSSVDSGVPVGRYGVFETARRTRSLEWRHCEDRVWNGPASGKRAPRVSAYKYCRRLLEPVYPRWARPGPGPHRHDSVLDTLGRALRCDGHVLLDDTVCCPHVVGRDSVCWTLSHLAASKRCVFGTRQGV